MAAVVEIENLTKDYEVGFWRKRKERALDGLTLQVEGGEIFGFLGANGAGKTTTLKLLMRLIYPTAGRARMRGRAINDVSMHARIGYLPENPYFYDYLTARELLNYCAELFGYTARERARRTEDLLARVHLDEKSWNKQLRKYSKGMLQRIGIAQALVNDPEGVFMDEPMSGLDPIGRREVRDLLLSLRAQGKTVFFSSHILSDVEALCDRAAILSRGKLIRCGTVQELTGSEDSALEIIAVGIDPSRLPKFSTQLSSLQSSTSTPNGVHLILSDETEVDKALTLIRECEGKLVSINPRRVSLEDIFDKADVAEEL